MNKTKTIGIVGAGFSGLAAAKTCLEYGYSIKMYEKDRELGGVWASSRRYPGVTPQNTKDTYCFSDFPMPKHFAEWPAGEDVQAYLLAYAKKFNVFSHIQFSHEIVSTEFENNVWIIKGKSEETAFETEVDFLIICNGTFCDAYIPPLQGIEGFLNAGGKLMHSSQFNNTQVAKDKRMVVVGYSKSAHDVVTAASGTATATHLIFREAKWKVPRYIKGLNMKYIILSRLGEAIIKPEQHNRTERFLYNIGLPNALLTFMEKYIGKRQKLDQLSLRPTSTIKDQAFGEITLETPGFFTKVLNGEIITHQTEIATFEGKKIILTNGETLEADLVIFATGFRQSISFLQNHFLEKFIDQEGNYLLYKHILPLGVPSLAFVGYNTSIQCPISSEFGALWVCEYLKGRITKPSQEQIEKEAKDFIKWRSQFRLQGSSSGLSTMPGTIHHVDMLLKDMNAPLPFFSLIPDWLMTINPKRYKKLRRKILKRNLQEKIN